MMMFVLQATLKSEGRLRFPQRQSVPHENHQNEPLREVQKEGSRNLLFQVRELVQEKAKSGWFELQWEYPDHHPEERSLWGFALKNFFVEHCVDSLKVKYLVYFLIVSFVGMTSLKLDSKKLAQSKKKRILASAKSLCDC